MADAAQSTEMARPRRTPEESALQESGRGAASLAAVLDRLLDCGIALEGNLTVGLAGVDLFYLDLRALLASIDTVWPEGRPAAGLGSPLRGSPALPAPLSTPPAPFSLPPRAAPRHMSGDVEQPPFAAALAATADERREGGLARLVLGLAELLHEVLERQALRRMRTGRLSAAEIEAVGAALLAQALEIERLRREFGGKDGEPFFALRLSDPSL
jgi:Gas vesicle protein K/Gas vesicle protein